MGAAAKLRRDGHGVLVSVGMEVVGYLFLLIYLMHLSCTVAVAGAATLSSSKMQKLLDVHKHLRKLNKPSLKTIQSPDGDIIDCVHISHQPAFDHPLLKDHKIQMKPSYHPKGHYDDKKMSDGTKKSVDSMAQLWHINGKCPIDTIPIRRTKKDDVMRASSVKMFGKKTNRSIPKHRRSLYSDQIDQSVEDSNLIDQSYEDSDLIDQSDQDSDLVDQSDQDPDLVDQSDQDPDLIDQSDNLNYQSDQDPDFIDQSDQDPDLDLNDQSDQDPDLIDQSEEDPYLVNKRVHEHATVYVKGDKYYGATAAINVWEPKIQQSDEFSLTQIWILGGSSGVDLNSIEAGWQANPHLFGDNNARLFVYWTNDAYKTTGCYNLLCFGFVQTNNNIAVGSTIPQFSEYSGSQYDISILIHKDPKDGNWWLKYGDEYLGYWPSSLFSYLSDSASMIEWGGEITNSESNEEHTSTEMGSGHFPKDGHYGKSSYVRNIQLVDSSNNLVDPQELLTIVDDSSCYDIDIQQTGTSDNEQWGRYFYHGGPGRNSDCT